MFNNLHFSISNMVNLKYTHEVSCYKKYLMQYLRGKKRHSIFYYYLNFDFNVNVSLRKSRMFLHCVVTSCWLHSHLPLLSKTVKQFDAQTQRTLPHCTREHVDQFRRISQGLLTLVECELR